LFDAVRPGVVEALGPLLESSRVAKAMHDCREDSAALFHQHGVRLRAVLDTQAAHTALERHRGNPPHQASQSDLLRLKLNVEDPPEVAEVKTQMRDDDRLWAKRPLNGILARYALHGVAHLLPLRRTLLQEAALVDATPSGRRRHSQLGRTSAWEAIESANRPIVGKPHKVEGMPTIDILAHVSQRAVDYRELNSSFASAAEMVKMGTKLWAFVAARTGVAVFFKLNAGRVGLASTPSAICRFEDVELGDIVLCCVSGINIDGSYIYLDRYDHDWEYYDHQRRPAGDPEIGAWGRDCRHEASLLNQDDPLRSSTDPLLLRGLPGAELLEQSEALDAWDADPEDLPFYHPSMDD